MSDPVREHGFSALPRNINVILGGKRANTEPRPMFVGDVNLPDSAVANKVHEYAKQELGQETYNHSMRVYFFSEETYFLTYMLHDIGSTSKNLPATLMSFEFYGAYLALELLYRDLQAPKEQAEAVVAEERTTIIAIVQHQDIRESGKITTVEQLIQLATIFDNMGDHAEMKHEGDDRRCRETLSTQSVVQLLRKYNP